MKRRTLDITFSVGGLVLAGLLLVLGLVLQNQANFADSYVKHQLSQQQITFTPVDKLAPEEQKAASRSRPASRPSATRTSTSVCT